MWSGFRGAPLSSRVTTTKLKTTRRVGKTNICYQGIHTIYLCHSMISLQFACKLRTHKGFPHNKRHKTQAMLSSWACSWKWIENGIWNSNTDHTFCPQRSKPFKYTYEKEIVMYAYHKKLDYFSTECIYSPNAYRGHARAFIKDLEKIRPSTIIDIIHSGTIFTVLDSFDISEQNSKWFILFIYT